MCLIFRNGFEFRADIRFCRLSRNTKNLTKTLLFEDSKVSEAEELNLNPAKSKQDICQNASNPNDFDGLRSFRINVSTNLQSQTA